MFLCWSMSNKTILLLLTFNYVIFAFRLNDFKKSGEESESLNMSI